MRFGLVHRIMTDALAALGLLALLTSGELNRWMAIAIVAGLVAALAIPESWRERPSLRRLQFVSPLVLFGVQAARLSIGEPLLPVLIEFAAGLQVLRLLTRRGAAHDQQVVVLALLHLIAGTVLGGGLSYGLCFLGFLIVAPGALVLSHLRREVEGNYRQGARDRTGLPVDVPRILRSRRVIGKRFLLVTCMLSVPIFVFTAMLFLLFPRVGLSLLLLNNPRERMTGFSERVDLGGVGRLRTDPTIVMRVEPPHLAASPPPRLALYLKGTAFDSYDGRSWSRSPGSGKVWADQLGRQVKLRRFPDPSRDSKMLIDLEPIDPAIVFLPSDAVALTLLATSQNALPSSRPTLYFFGTEGTLYYRSPDERGLRYEVSLADQEDRRPESLSHFERTRYLTLPALPDRVPELARRWTADVSDPREMARRVEHHLRTEYTYDLDSPSGAAKNPLDHFLFVSKRGHCEFYSTAMAVLLRSRGVPTRNVTGFVGGTFNRFSQTYAVRQGDAHSWVEVYLDGAGWVRFDPTPPSGATPQSEINGVLVMIRDLIEALGQRWNRHVVGYDLKQQIWLFQGVRSAYHRIVPEQEMTSRLLSSPRRALISLLAVLGIAWAAREIWRRRRSEPQSEILSLAERRALQVVELYQALDRVMMLRGAARASGTPPLTHALALVDSGHPIGQEVLSLTELYLRARFGGYLLTPEEFADFAYRIRVLKQTKPESVAA
ncbi:MAG TPA: transglutaminaseTgpA domain-containing protein [Polyangiaceae bacterium]|nr:transglutaminaseTgpA domain-containing protein [Polyangiaceae bacterium]